MKTKTFSNPRRVLAALLAAAALSAVISVPMRAATFHAYRDAISGTYYFPRPLLPVGEQPPSESESEQLWQILEVWRASNHKVGLADLEMFLAGYTNSPWGPSLHANLGQHYLDDGYISLALEHWEQAWIETQEFHAGNGKKVADYTLAHWTRLLASLGRYEALALLVEQNWDRILDRGPLSQMWARTREAFVEMGKYPGTSYKCGSYALEQVAKTLRLQYDPRVLLRVPSPASGFSMKTLADLSTQLGLGLVAVARDTDTRLVVPSVVHWEQSHYGAIVSRTGNLYLVVDPTFGEPRLLTAEAINAEASGYFMVAANQIPPGWRTLRSGETGLIFGRGNPNFLGDKDDQKCTSCEQCPLGTGGNGTGNNGVSGPRAASGSPSCSNCGMVQWGISEPWINIWLSDEPMGYSPALGPRILFSLNYKQRDENPDPMSYCSSAGLNWNCSWLSYIDAPYGVAYANLYLAGGGKSYFLFTDQTPTNYFNNMRLHAQTNSQGVPISYDFLYPDGSKDVYGLTPTNSYGNSIERSYLTQKIDPQNYTTSFLYEAYDPDAINIRAEVRGRSRWAHKHDFLRDQRP